MFKTLGLLVALYTLYAAFTGTVYTKAGPRGRMLSRKDSPEYFWVVIAIYLGLSIVLMTVF
jgi:hypothetical protein